MQPTEHRATYSIVTLSHMVNVYYYYAFLFCAFVGVWRDRVKVNEP